MCITQSLERSESQLRISGGLDGTTVRNQDPIQREFGAEIERDFKYSGIREYVCPTQYHLQSISSSFIDFPRCFKPITCQ